ncbi:MAG: DNA/RNA helicase domain-containing protein, partial [Longicatena sp.]
KKSTLKSILFIVIYFNNTHLFFFYLNFQIAVLYDKNAKRGLSDDEIRSNVLNAYYVLLTRARRGVYLYICDKALRDYFKRFF